MNPDHAPDDRDQLSRFMIRGAGVRGVLVHLQHTWEQIRGRDNYPAAAAELLGEATAAAAIFTGHAKVEGRLSVQLKSNGPLRTLFAECTAAGTLRAIAQLSEHGVVTRDLSRLGSDAVLAITIENPSVGGREPMRYQGLVSLSADSMSGAFEDYFLQSEQLPTRVLLASDEQHAVGLMLQKLPGDESDADGWSRSCALFDTLGPAELLASEGTDILLRLFHEDGVELLGQRALRFGCSCSRGRVESMLASLGPDEARASAIDGEALVRCEFCGQKYTFTEADIEELLRAEPVALAPDRVQ